MSHTHGLLRCDHRGDPENQTLRYVWLKPPARDENVLSPRKVNFNEGRCCVGLLYFRLDLAPHGLRLGHRPPQLITLRLRMLTLT